MERDPGGMEWMAAYLEWMSGGTVRVVVEAAPEPEPDGLSLAERESRRETTLMEAMHMQAECVRIVAQILERGARSPQALAQALETLRLADRMLADEQEAWHALRLKRRATRARTPREAWDNQVAYQWDTALDHLAADMHTLTGRVLALQTAER